MQLARTKDAYLFPNVCQGDEAQLFTRPGTNPFLIEVVVVEHHDGLDAVPVAGARSNAQATVCDGGGDICVH